MASAQERAPGHALPTALAACLARRGSPSGAHRRQASSGVARPRHAAGWGRGGPPGATRGEGLGKGGSMASVLRQCKLLKDEPFRAQETGGELTQQTSRKAGGRISDGIAQRRRSLKRYASVVRTSPPRPRATAWAAGRAVHRSATCLMPPSQTLLGTNGQEQWEAGRPPASDDAGAAC